MERKKALLMYLSGALGQILITCIIAFTMRNNGIKADYTTFPGMLVIAIGGISSALWGILVSIRYRNVTLKDILIDFINVKQPFSSYALVFMFLLLDFGYIAIGGKLQIDYWYTPVILFLTAILFGGIEEIGWRYTFQPIMEQTVPYVISTVITFVFWGIWHFMYFYIDGSINQIQAIPFLMGLLTNCFILSALYHKTKSLWICAMTHALINVFSQTAIDGNPYILFLCQVIIIVFAIGISTRQKDTTQS